VWLTKIKNTVIKLNKRYDDFLNFAVHSSGKGSVLGAKT
jgi:hypothetical protein